MPLKRARLGFTLVELLIVLVVIAILVTIALPNLLSARLATHETAAMATLHLIVQAQAHFVQAQACDQDRNGVGEFGTFGELSGSIAIRAAAGGTKIADPNLISPAFRGVSGVGELRRGGYIFRIYLPDANGRGLSELPWGGADAAVDPGESEGLWCVYAWPQKYDTTGRRTFFVNQSGNILFTEDPTYTGTAAHIAPGAALTGPEAPAQMDGQAAVNEVARDGNLWRVAGG